MKLKIQEALETRTLEDITNELKITVKEKGDLILLKYHQIDSDMSHPIVQECRGLILKKNTWKVVSLAFKKFFNVEEGHAAKIDWNTAKVFCKHDGSLIQLYFFDDEWHVATSGTIDANTIANDGPYTFKELFWNTILKQYDKTKETFTELLDQNFCYAFELQSPYNIVITQHAFSKVTLIGIRNLNTLEEHSVKDNIFFQSPEIFDLNNVEEIKNTFKGMDWQNEGYVVCDDNFNRVKIKNPAYISIHHLKGKLGLHNIIEIVKTNEIDEFCGIFKEREEEARLLLSR